MQIKPSEDFQQSHSAVEVDGREDEKLITSGHPHVWSHGAKILFLAMFQKYRGAGETAQWLRVLAALPEALSSIPSNHIVAHNHL